MFQMLQNPLALAGRLLMAALFLPAGIHKVTGFAGTVGHISSAGLPMPEVAAALAVAVEIGAAVALILGYRTRLAAIALAVFTLVASYFFHNYWALPADKAFVNQLMFWKNIAIAGGLLGFAAFGAGRLSIDKK